MTRLIVSYEVRDAQGETLDTGDEDDVDCACDDGDRDDGLTPVDRAVQALRDSGMWPVSSRFRVGDWYEQTEGHTDFRSGQTRVLSARPHGFSPWQQRQIFDGVTNAGRYRRLPDELLAQAAWHTRRRRQQQPGEK